MATIGRARAVAEVAGLKMRGLLAWLAWLFVHVLLLVGFRNRLAVIFSWAWSYVTFNRGSRLITRKVPPTLLAYDYDYDDAPAAGARQTTGDGSTAPTSKPPAEARSVP